jgi:hypothetical protein
MDEDRSIWWWVLLGAALIAAAAGGYLWWQRSRVPAPPPQPVALQGPPEVAAPAPEAPKGEAKIEHPIEQAPAAAGQAAEPLPPLDNSDTAMREALARVIGTARLNDTLMMQNIVYRIVATVDNLPREKLSQKIVPVKPVGGAFVVAGEGEARAIGPDNERRYAGYLALVKALDAKTIATLYARFYPLFQQAYRELGYPKGYFNDRLVQVIDHLLAAPEVSDAKLVQPKVLYEFADPQLEALSAGQKVMVRIGPENARAVKAKLREIRREVTTRALPGG